MRTRRPATRGGAPSGARSASAARGAPAAARGAAPGERLQKVLAQLGLASRREAEEWIRAGRLSVNGTTAVLGTRVQEGDTLRLDGRQVRQRATAREQVYLCHRSPGEPLLPKENAGENAEPQLSLAERMPRSAGKRWVSVSPMPQIDGGLELLSADGALAAQIQRAVRGLHSEFSVRVRGELNDQQIQGALGGELDRGVTLQVLELTPSGGEGSNRWYQLVTLGASGKDVRQLLERQGATLSRVMRVRLGTLQLERSLPRGRTRALTDEELQALLAPPPVA
ncbi:MAG: S4 domain-containing protein [Steroidobacteraceae bacterium]